MTFAELLKQIIADEKRDEEHRKAAEAVNRRYGVEIDTAHPNAPSGAMPSEADMVNSPPHYRAGDTYETIRVIEAWNLGFNLGNAVKYISRWQSKGGVEDLKKARWYLDREIAKLGGK